jgi:hypothetical protein
MADGPQHKSIVTLPKFPGGCKFAVSLVYAGGYADHLESALPLLNLLEMPATFMVDPAEILLHANLWKRAHLDNIELGVLPGGPLDQDVSRWSSDLVEQEVDEASRLLKELLGRTPIGTMYDGARTPVNKQDFHLALEDGINELNFSKDWIKTVICRQYPTDFEALFRAKAPSWIVIRFESLLEPTHNEILVHRLVVEALNRMRDQVWITTPRNMMEYVAG